MCYLNVIESYLRNKGLDNKQIEGIKGNMTMASSDHPNHRYSPDVKIIDGSVVETEYD